MSYFSELFSDKQIYILDYHAPIDNDAQMLCDYQGIKIDLEALLVLLYDLLHKSNADGHGPDLSMLPVWQILSSIMERCHQREFNQISVIVEDGYVDRYYRASYYMHYSSKHYDINRRCVRVFIFEGNINEYDELHKKQSISTIEKALNKRFLGYFVLTPIRGCNISKSVFTPRAFVDSQQSLSIRTCPYYCTMYGLHLDISGFPYMKQDSETLSCAEVTILLLTDYFSEKYQEYRVVLPNDVIRIANLYTPQRTTPSIGMKYDGLAHILKDIGFEPVLLNAQNYSTKIHYMIHSYIDSSIPIAVHISDKEELEHIHHSIVCLGFEKDAPQDFSPSQQIIISPSGDTDNCIYVIESSQYHNSYYVMDDNEEPYRKITLKKKQHYYSSNPCKCRFETSLEYSDQDSRKIVSVILPLNKGMVMQADDAYTVFTQILAGPFGITEYLRHELDQQEQKSIFDLLQISSDQLPGATSSSPLIIRIFMAASRSLKHKRIGKMSADAASVYVAAPMPRFVWVCEIYTKKSYAENKVIGELILDATSAQCDGDRSLILCHYPNMIAYRTPDKEYYPTLWKDLFASAIVPQKWEPYLAFQAGNTWTGLDK